MTTESLDSAGLPDESIEAEAARWIAYVRREITYLTPRQFLGNRRMIKIRQPDLAHFLADAAERALEPQADAELGARAAKLVAEMLHQAGRYLTGDFGEINEVLIEARQRGWLEPTDG